MQNKEKLMITEREKDKYIDALTDELSILRAKAMIPQDELAKLIGISRQTYGAIERKSRRMSWNTYLSLILFFDYTKSTHKMLRKLSIFPDELINKFNQYNKDIEIEDEYIFGLSLDSINKLDDKALHAIKTVVKMEYLRCNKISNDNFDKINILNR